MAGLSVILFGDVELSFNCMGREGAKAEKMR
jgi:hypothetical protein